MRSPQTSVLWSQRHFTDMKGSEHLPAGDCHKPLHSIVQPHRAYQDPWQCPTIKGWSGLIYGTVVVQSPECLKTMEASGMLCNSLRAILCMVNTVHGGCWHPGRCTCNQKEPSEYLLVKWEFHNISPFTSSLFITTHKSHMCTHTDHLGSAHCF